MEKGKKKTILQLFWELWSPNWSDCQSHDFNDDNVKGCHSDAGEDSSHLDVTPCRLVVTDVLKGRNVVIFRVKKGYRFAAEDTGARILETWVTRLPIWRNIKKT
jgi:hypothetical protein